MSTHPRHKQLCITWQTDLPREKINLTRKQVSELEANSVWPYSRKTGTEYCQCYHNWHSDYPTYTNDEFNVLLSQLIAEK